MSRILIVDDDRDVRLSIRLAIETDLTLGDDAVVLEAVSGEDAIEVLTAERVDLMLLDVMMPRLDGFATLRAIRLQTGDALPIVMLTAKGREADVANAFRAGADAYLTKPFDVDALLDVVRDMIAMSPGDRRARRRDELARAELLLQLEHSFGNFD